MLIHPWLAWLGALTVRRRTQTKELRNAIHQTSGRDGGNPRSSVPRTGCSGPVPASASSCSPRPATPVRCRKPARHWVATERCTSSASPAPGASHGTLTMVYRGNEMHTGFDNVSFSSANTALVAEDAGDTLHTQQMRSTRCGRSAPTSTTARPAPRLRSGCCTSDETRRPPSTRASREWTATERG